MMGENDLRSFFLGYNGISNKISGVVIALTSNKAKVYLGQTPRISHERIWIN
jgi:hypothetical protein